jgi:hypothetical protein
MTIWNYLYGFPIHFLRITPILYSKKLVKYLKLRLRKYTFPSESTEYGSSTAVCGQVGNDSGSMLRYEQILGNL